MSARPPSAPTRQSDVTASGSELAEPIVCHRNPARWVVHALLTVAAAMFVHSVITNGLWHWDVAGRYLFDPLVLRGLWVTVILTVGAVVGGLLLGAVVAGMRMSSSRTVSTLAGCYIWFFRGVPVIVQVIFWVYLAQLYPTLSLGVPFGPEYIYFDTNKLIAPMAGCMIGLCLNESAYMAEILRGAIAGIPQGQREAASALGMTPAQVRRRVVTPQILPIVIPPLFNNVVAMTKTTAVVVLASVTDLFSAVTQIGSRNLKPMPLLLVATVWYLVLAVVITGLQLLLERLVNKATRRHHQGARS